MNTTSSENVGTEAGEVFQFIVQGVGITVVACFGIIGNILSLVVVTRPKLKSSITWLLIGLSLFDLIFLALNVLIYSLIASFTYLGIAEDYVRSLDPVQNPFLVVINDTAQTASVYFTIFIALERYLVVKWPIESRSICTYERVRILSVVVFLFSCAYQAMRFLFPSYDVSPEYYAELAQECPGLGISINGTERGAEADYEDYFFRWPYLTFIMIGPSVILTIVNGSIWQAVISSRKATLHLTSKKLEDRERSITIMLLAVVSAFLLCQIAFYVMVLLERFDKCAWHEWNVYLISVDLFLITVNSSVNFLIYCTFGSNFRKQFGQLMCMGKVKQQSRGDNSSTNPSTGRTDVSGTKMQRY